MPRFYPFTWLLAGLLVGSAPAWAQQAPAPTISGDFRNLRFEEFARRVEAQTPYRFYFDPAKLAGVTVQAQPAGLPLEAVLTQILAQTGLRFAVDAASNHVFITPDYPLQTQLPGGLFADEPAGSGAPADVAAADAPADQPAQVGTSEFRVHEIGSRQAAPASGRATLTGVVRVGQEPALGVAVFVDSPNIGTATDKQGAYSLSLPPGRYNLTIRGLGVRTTRRQIWVRGNGRLDLEVLPAATSLREVVVKGDKQSNVRGTQMGVQKLDIKTIKQIPTVFGEADLLRVVTALPGVKTIGEGSTG